MSQNTVALNIIQMIQEVRNFWSQTNQPYLGAWDFKPDRKYIAFVMHECIPDKPECFSINLECDFDRIHYQDGFITRTSAIVALIRFLYENRDLKKFRERGKKL